MAQDKMAETQQRVKPIGTGTKILLTLIQLTEMLGLIVSAINIFIFFDFSSSMKLKYEEELSKDQNLRFQFFLLEFVGIIVMVCAFLFSVWQNILLNVGITMGCSVKLGRYWRNQKLLILTQVVVGGLLTFYYEMVPAYVLIVGVVYATAVGSFVNLHNVTNLGYKTECCCGCYVRWGEKKLKEIVVKV